MRVDFVTKETGTKERDFCIKTRGETPPRRAALERGGASAGDSAQKLEPVEEGVSLPWETRLQHTAPPGSLLHKKRSDEMNSRTAVSG